MQAKGWSLRKEAASIQRRERVTQKQLGNEEMQLGLKILINGG